MHSHFSVSVLCARLSRPSHQPLSARKYSVSYRIVSYANVGPGSGPYFRSLPLPAV